MNHFNTIVPATALFLAITTSYTTGCSEKSNTSKSEPPKENTTPSTPPKTDVASQPQVPAPELTWLASPEEALKQGNTAQKYVFIDFTADWCTACKELDTKTFSVPGIAKQLQENFVLLRLDVTAQSEQDKQLMSRFGVKVLPAILATQNENVYLQINRWVGPRDLEQHLNALPAYQASQATP